MNSCPERTGGFASAARGIDCQRLVLQNAKPAARLEPPAFFCAGASKSAIDHKKTSSPFKNRAFPPGTISQAGQYSDNSLKARSVGQICKGDWDNGNSEWEGIH